MLCRCADMFFIPPPVPSELRITTIKVTYSLLFHTPVQTSRPHTEKKVLLPSGLFLNVCIARAIYGFKGLTAGRLLHGSAVWSRKKTGFRIPSAAGEGWFVRATGREWELEWNDWRGDERRKYKKADIWRVEQCWNCQCSLHLWLMVDPQMDVARRISARNWSLVSLFHTGSRSRHCPPDPHGSPRESGGDDHTLHADGHKHPAEERHLGGNRLLWFPVPLHGPDLGWHPRCVPGHRRLHLCGYEVSGA